MRVAVTGANGMVGKAVVKDLIANKYDVCSIVHNRDDTSPFEQIEIDIRNYDDVYKAMKDCQALIHLAAIPSPRPGKNHIVFETNAVGTYNVLLAAGLHGIKRVAVASSDSILGLTYSINKPTPEYLPVDDKHPLKPDDTYGLSKIVSEEIAEAMSLRFKMSIATLRISHVMTEDKYQKDQFKKWQQDPEEGPWNLWSYIDNRDAARVFRLAIENDLKGHEIFFITAEDTRSLIKSDKLIEKYFPKADIITDFKGYETLENIEKAKKLLNFVPKYSWRNILKI